MIKPVQDKIAVEQDSDEDTTPAGLVIPEGMQKEKPATGCVRAVGPGKARAYRPGVAIGDKVAFKRNAGIDVEHDGNTYRVLQEDDILAILS
jgi:chaperonin GroES